MTTQHNNIYEALLVAKQSFKPLKKTGRNPHFKNEYSTLDDIRDATLESLNTNGIVVTHEGRVEAEYTVLTTIVRHAASNTFVTSSFFIDNDAPQKMGSAMTYGRRYNIVNLLDLIADVDDDGESFYNRSAPAATSSKRKGLGGKVS